MLKDMLFSIVIPYYNGQATIKKCVDSIYRQGLGKEDFEIIIVDDCSPKSDAWEYLKLLAEDVCYAPNIHPVRLKENLRQGGARNKGIKQAQGEYIVFIDQDDWLSEGALSKIKHVLERDRLDVLMVDFQESRGGGDIQCISNYAQNSQIIQSGADFICSNEVPWVPWCYIYNRRFLLDNHLAFTEHVRFEDVDFVMRVTLTARSITFRSIHCVVQSISNLQTTFVGSDINRIRDLFHMAWRVRKVSEQFQNQCPQGAKAVMNHHYFMYQSFIRRYLWRIPSKDILHILNTYPAEEHTTDWLTQLSINHPKIFAYTLSAFRPILNVLWRIKQILK
jgi:glycosyltransferase involved in cell wall biosynthesis